MTDLLVEVDSVYRGSDAARTVALYDRLKAIGPIGLVAVNLMRACKASERAKLYKGRYTGAAYDKKQWSMDQLCTQLGHDAEMLGIVWGWGIDPAQPKHKHVLYVDLPDGLGQVSFHTEQRGTGPDYLKPWDGQRGVGAGRICQFAAKLLEQIR